MNNDFRFIEDQRGPRDMKLNVSNGRIIQRVTNKEERKPKKKGVQTESETVFFESSTTDISSESLPDIDYDPKPSTSNRKLARETTLAAKVSHVSVRAQSELLLDASESLGVSNIGLSKSNVHRIGKQVVKCTAEAARDNIKSKKGKPMILHYDGKIVKEVTKFKKLSRDRVALTVNIDNENYVLGVPPCPDSTGESQYCEINTLLNEYDIKDDIVGLVFDTTASNTGREKGVNIRLNQSLGRPLLNLACRHHVKECHIKYVNKMFRTTCGPDNPIFKKLSENFLELDIDVTKLSKYEYGKNLELDIVAKETLDQINNLVSVNVLPRGDYYELANLIQFYLDPENNDIRLKQPGAVHHARFLS